MTARASPHLGPVPSRRRAPWRLLLLGVLACLVGPLAQALPTFAEVRQGYVESDAWLLDRAGKPLQSLRINRDVRRLPWTPLEAISPALRQALLYSEDRHFYEHAGVDWSAAAASAWRNLWNTRTRGASTVTMQLAGLLVEEERRQGRRSLLEKVGQTATALRLEQLWRKDQILEAYLNLVTYRGELQGVGAMSRGLFGKWPEGLDSQEAAIAAVLLRGPNAPVAQVNKRACQLLKDMGRNEGCASLEGLVTAALGGSLRDGEGTTPLAPHLARRLLKVPGQRLRSTLDGGLQRFAFNALHRQLERLSQRNVEDGALLVIDNASGEVRAWVGSSGDLSGAAEVDGVSALRQAGSTLKPFLYELAIERRDLTAASLVEDAPLSVATGGGLYNPQNYEPVYRGWVSTRQALGGSLNTPAVRTVLRVGVDRFRDRLLSLGLTSLKESGDYYGPSLALGSADVSLLMLANAYRSLANGGQWSPLRVLSAPTENDGPPCRQSGCEGVFSGSAHRAAQAPASAIVADILSDRNARAGTFGLESWLATPYWAAAKTGTSKDMRDNWCIGFSRQYTVAVWVGNASGEPMHDVSGITGAAPVWREVMDWLHLGDPRTGRARVRSSPPSPPAGVVVGQVQFEPAKEPARQEWFLAGTERRLIQQVGPVEAKTSPAGPASTGRGIARRGGSEGVSGENLARISYPAEGVVIALDPDIPPGRQKIPLRLSASVGPGWQWKMDDQRLAEAGTALNSASPYLWLPRPGRHRLQLLDGRGLAVDSVAFEVRALKGSSGGKR